MKGKIDFDSLIIPVFIISMAVVLIFEIVMTNKTIIEEEKTKQMMIQQNQNVIIEETTK